MGNLRSKRGKKMDAPQYDVPVPDRLADAPRDHRGFIVPFFVAWLDNGRQVRRGEGLPDFRVVDSSAMAACTRHHLCWLCGKPLGRHRAFVLGPMCAITRVNSEPPSHRSCAEYAMRVCPFLSRPAMRRNPSPFKVEGTVPAPGEHNERNPGLMALWITNGARMFWADEGRPGLLFEVNEPSEVTWWREGRAATREEVERGLAEGMSILEVEAASRGPAAVRDLDRLSRRVVPFIPGAAA
jgi:hypothetical protein